MSEQRTEPIEDMYQDRAYLTVAAVYQDPLTKATYVHRDLERVQDPYAFEDHVGPFARTESFGDAESWADYVRRYAVPDTTLLTWNARGLRAILDYADASTKAPGRCAWSVAYPFAASTQWDNWASITTGRALSQRDLIEALEDRAEDIQAPTQADLLNLLRNLRGSVKAQANAELRPDGSTKVAFERDSQVKGAADIELPPMIMISIPVLRGHTDDVGKPVYYLLAVRLRVSVGDNAQLGFRLTLPNAARVMEDACRERSLKAATLLGEGYTLLRAAD